MPLLPLIHLYSRYIPVFTKKKKHVIANGVAIATVYCNLAIAVYISLQDTPLDSTQGYLSCKTYFTVLRCFHFTTFRSSTFIGPTYL